ncbi:MAG: BMP family ABC transporter substrate-binding protein [Candidatus Hadarchaeales archaeon]
MERGMATSVVFVIALIIGLVIGVGVGYVIAPKTVEQTTPTPQPTQLTMGVVMWWHHDEGTWSPSHAKAVESVCGRYGIVYTWIEETGIQDVASVIEQAASTYDIVYVETDEFIEAAIAAAERHPDVYFIQEWEAGPIENAPYSIPNNMICINAANVHQLHFIAGAVAGLLTQTNKLGLIIAIPGPRANRTVANPFREGARYSNPNITVTRVDMNSYSDPARARDTVRSFHEAGIDVVFINQDDFAGTLEAAALGMYTTQEYIDMVQYYPDTLFGSCIWDWTKPLERAVEAIVNGTWNNLRSASAEIYLSLEDGSLDIPTWGNMVTEEIKAYAAELKENIINGTVVVPDNSEWVD